MDSVRHLLSSGQPCPVLQYADDTLIVIRGVQDNVQRLKMILDDFAAATGLQINFSKTTAVPIHLDEATAQQCISILGCKRESFPWTYLGLPLSVNKLSRHAYSPYIAKSDRYMAGWQSALLIVMGRAVLVNSVLDSQLIYAMSMCALPLPPGIIAQMDQRRRSFLWSGESSMTGSQSLVAWEKVCWSRDHGGLGIKDLSLMDVCLLIKLLHRLQVADKSAWVIWVREHACLASLEGDICGSHWDVLRTLLPLYQAVTIVTIGDGAQTSFWYDAWDNEAALVDRFPALYSHCIKKKLSVAKVRDMGVDSPGLFVDRLSLLAQAELSEVRQIIAGTQFQDTLDSRAGAFCLPNGKFDSGGLYRLLKSRDGSPIRCLLQNLFGKAMHRNRFNSSYGSSCKVGSNAGPTWCERRCWTMQFVKYATRRMRRQNMFSWTAHLQKNFGEQLDSIFLQTAPD